MKKIIILVILSLVLSPIFSQSISELEARYYQLILEINELWNKMMLLPADSSLREPLQNQIDGLVLEILIITDELRKREEEKQVF